MAIYNKPLEDVIGQTQNSTLGTVTLASRRGSLANSQCFSQAVSRSTSTVATMQLHFAKTLMETDQQSNMLDRYMRENPALTSEQSEHYAKIKGFLNGKVQTVQTFMQKLQTSLSEIRD